MASNCVMKRNWVLATLSGIYIKLCLRPLLPLNFSVILANKLLFFFFFAYAYLGWIFGLLELIEF